MGWIASISHLSETGRGLRRQSTDRSIIALSRAAMSCLSLKVHSRSSRNLNLNMRKSVDELGGDTVLKCLEFGERGQRGRLEISLLNIRASRSSVA